jgi:hypothetical protein
LTVKSFIPVLAGLLALTGCATVAERGNDVEAVGLNLIAELHRTLPGDYATVLSRQQRLDAIEPLLLNVRAEPSFDPGELILVLAQRQGDGPLRSFLLTVSISETPDRLDGAFAPLDERGQPRRDCAMEFSVRTDGFSGQTDPQSCRFGEGERATGLIKEIAFDGDQLVIGDRLVRLADGMPAADDQIHSFFRVRYFSGWAGRLEGDRWRLAKAFELHSGDGYIEPVDAAGMSLGLGVELARHEPGSERGQILRLSLIDLDSGEILAQSWADPDAESLGIALPDVQVGLEPGQY